MKNLRTLLMLGAALPAAIAGSGVRAGIMRDTTNQVNVKRFIDPASTGDNTAIVSQIIDRQGYQALLIALALGSIADADVTVTALLEESNASDMSGANTVADADMISETPGTAPLTAGTFKFDSDNQVRKLGYIGTKRYVRLTLTPANNTGAALVSGMALLMSPNFAPVAQGTT